MKQYIEETNILDYSHPKIQQLIQEKRWQEQEPEIQIRSIYNFVKDDILFGYNSGDDIPASEVLTDRYGQCNTKSILLMALLRAVGIPNRIHGFTINKELQKGAISGIWYTLAPQSILHSWVEVFIQGQWYFLEGVILDQTYLTQLQKKFNSCKTTFCGYGADTDNFQNPPIQWDFNHTYIQKNGINQDFGLFDSPDLFYAKHQQKLNGVKKLMFRLFIRNHMNTNVQRIRNGDK